MNSSVQPYTKLQDTALLVLRLVVAAIFMYAGSAKWPFWSTAPEGMSVTLLNIMKLLSIVEPLGSVALVLGVLTRWAAAGLAIIMVGAIYFARFTMHASLFTTPQGTGLDYNLLILAGCIALFAFGGGRWSVDAIRKKSFAPALILTAALSGAVVAQAQKPTTGYAPVNGLKMYYEIHGSGSGEPLVLLHGSFMTIPNNWTGWIGELSKNRKVIAVEMQGHGRTGDINRDFSHENLADDIAALLDYLKIARADLLGYSMGGGVAMQVAIRHPEKVRKVVSISAFFRRDGVVKEALDVFPKLTAEAFKGSPIETEYKKLSPTPNEFPNFVKRVLAPTLKPYDFGAANLKATRAPFLFIHGDADGVRLDHIAEMFRLKDGEIHGDLRPRSESRLAVLPNTTHVTLMQKADIIVPMVNDFLDAKSQTK